METPSDSGSHIGSATGRIAQRIGIIAENRLQLFLVEAQEERERVLRSICLALGAVAFGLLAGIAVTLVIVVALWDHSPVIALLVLTALYTLAAVFFFARLVQLQSGWQTLSGTLEQLKKDRECLEKTFN
ncbi:MAG TPA: phage holin family protein [Verrucomicrobiae bacterium]|nr:phage holin family protein [Verrucomicrobiae bacterium]